MKTKITKLEENARNTFYIIFRGERLAVTWDTKKDVYELFIKNEYYATVKVAYDSTRDILVERARKAYPRLRNVDDSLFEFRYIQRV